MNRTLHELAMAIMDKAKTSNIDDSDPRLSAWVLWVVRSGVPA